VPLRASRRVVLGLFGMPVVAVTGVVAGDRPALAQDHGAHIPAITGVQVGQDDPPVPVGARTMLQFHPATHEPGHQVLGLGVAALAYLGGVVAEQSHVPAIGQLHSVTVHRPAPDGTRPRPAREPRHRRRPEQLSAPLPRCVWWSSSSPSRVVPVTRQCPRQVRHVDGPIGRGTLGRSEGHRAPVSAGLGWAVGARSLVQVQPGCEGVACLEGPGCVGAFGRWPGLWHANRTPLRTCRTTYGLTG
jgi:hypothetical protein